jgi:RHS repeat-associated protein
VYRYDGLSRVVSSRTRVELPGRADVSELAKPQTTGELRYRIPSSRAVSAVAGGIRKAIYSEVSVGRQTLAVSGPHGPRHLSRDLLGSVTVVTGSGIGTAELYEYDAFGSSLGAAPDVVQPYGYNGKPFDSLTCTYDYGFRDYSPALGRFSTPDPAQYGSNWYVYVNADPINFVDPWGLMPASDDEAAWVVGIGFGLRPVEFGYGQDRYRLADKDRLQRDIRTSTMYQPAAGGNYNLPAASKTWCNQACFDYMAATAPGLFTAATGGGRDRRHLTDPIDPSYNVNANEAAANLAAAAALNSTIRRAPQSQWLFESLGLPTTVREVNGQQAQTLGNEGYTVVAVRPASPSGHMAVVARDGSRYDHSLGPRVSHVGRRKGETTDALDAFGDTVSGVRYFYDQSQRRSFIDFSQGANTYVP